MMSALIAFAALAATPTAPTSDTVQIYVGRADWSAFPAPRLAPRPLPTGAMINRVERILRDRECVIRGQSARRFDITVPYLVLLEPNGTAARVVVEDLGCRPIEDLVGLIVVELGEHGDFRPTGEQEARWYASDLNFNLTVNH